MVANMQFVFDFLRQEVPKSGKNIPAYYRKALFITELLLSVYFLLGVVLVAWATGRVDWLPIVILVVTVLALLKAGKIKARLNLAGIAIVIGAWLAWYVRLFGWSAGSPNILVPILSLAFFNLYEPPRGKIAYFLGLVAFRIALFAFSLKHPPVSALNQPANLIFQIVNSVLPLLILALNYILFSSSIQANERQLTINNQE